MTQNSQCWADSKFPTGLRISRVLTRSPSTGVRPDLASGTLPTAGGDSPCPESRTLNRTTAGGPSTIPVPLTASHQVFNGCCRCAWWWMPISLRGQTLWRCGWRYTQLQLLLSPAFFLFLKCVPWSLVCVCVCVCVTYTCISLSSEHDSFLQIPWWCTPWLWDSQRGG